MTETGKARTRHVVFNLFSTLLALILVLVIGELITRVVIKVPNPPYDNKQKDETLGWTTKPEYHFETENFYDYKRRRYSLDINFTKYGFRLWDTTSFKQPSILFIGDSYTESLEASDKEVFYSIFRDSLPFRVFATGTAGYGTTQELLMLRQFIDSINPECVVLEMCSNDFADNYWQLEENTGYKVGLRRPYLMLDNKIEYHHPHYWIEDVKQYSHLIYFLFTRIKNAFVKLNILSQASIADKMIHQYGLAYRDYSIAYQLTDNCLQNIKNELDKRHIKLVVFMADDYEPGETNLKNICRKNGVEIIESVAQQVRKHENSGEVVRAYDGYHWNPTGQKIVSDEIIRYYRNNVVDK